MRMEALSKELAAENWSKLNVKERTELMQRVENLEAESQNRPAAKVSTENMSDQQRGYYAPNQNAIVQNHDMVKYSPTSDQVRTNVLHEGRHAYQHDVVSHPENHPEVSKGTVQAWSDNLAPGHYVQAKQDLYGYYNQPVERDARQYAETQTQAYSQNASQTQGNAQGQGQSASNSAGHSNSSGQGQSNESGGESNSNSQGMGIT